MEALYIIGLWGTVIIVFMNMGFFPAILAYFLYTIIIPKPYDE